MLVYGIQFDPQEREAAELTRKVMNLALIFVFLAFVSCIQEVQSGRAADALWWLMVSLAMPYCGYYGAKNKDRNLLCMFYSINLAIAIMYVLTVLLIMVFISAIDPAVQECQGQQAEGTFEEDIRLDDPEADVSHGTGGVSREGQQMDDEQCDYWEHAQTRKADMYMQVIVYVCQVVLNCSAFSNGKRLATLPYFGGPDTRYGSSPATRAAARAAARQQERDTRRGDFVHAAVVEAVSVPVVVEPPVHPQLRPGEVMSGRVFEVESTSNPTAFGGAAGGAPMGTVVMGTVVYDDVPDPECPAQHS